MIYLLAAVGAITVAVLLWKAFGPERMPGQGGRQAPIAPDDDPDFLRELDEQQRKPRSGNDEE